MRKWTVALILIALTLALILLLPMFRGTERCDSFFMLKGVVKGCAHGSG